MFKLWLAFLFLAGCSSGPEVAGTSEHGNAFVAGIIYMPDGQPAEGAAVTLRPQNFLDSAGPPLSKTSRKKAETTVEPDGSFRIDNLDSGAYAIEIRDVSNLALLLRCEVETSESQLILEPGILGPTTTISGSIDSALAAGRTLIAQVYGLEYHSFVEPDGSFTLDGLPAGTYSLRIAALDGPFTPIIYDSIPSAVIDTTGSDTTVIDTTAIDTTAIDTTGHPYAAWSFSKNIFINTAASGANISEDIHDFPLLIRLVDSVFDFSTAAGSGADIRFSKPDGTPLPYEMEVWDSAGTDAVLWVRVDTVLGNDSNQYIILWSGNPSAASQSDGAAVFGTGTGYEAVWHFNEEQAGTGAAGLYQDASGNGYHGDDFISSTRVSGVVGRGHWFDGVDDYISVAASVVEMGRSGFTLELWAQADSAGGCILYKGDSLSSWSDGGRMIYMGGGASDSLGGGLFPSIAGYGSGYAATADTIPFSEYDHYAFCWNYLGGDSGMVSIYRNGRLMPLASETYRVPAADNPGSTIWIGAGPGMDGGGFFNGSIDELRVSPSARSDAWIQLCYQSQRRAVSILRFE